MNKLKIFTVILAMSLSAYVGAQTADDPSVQIDNTVTAAPGDTGVIDGVGYTQDTSGGEQSVADGWDIDFSADAALVDQVVPEVRDVFDSNWKSCVGTSITFAANQQYTCSEPSPGVIRVILENTANDPLDSQAIGDFFRLNVDVAASAPPAEQIDFVITNHQPATAAGQDMAAGTFGAANQDGQITIECPAGESCYQSNPSIGSTIAFGSAVVGQATTPVETIGVSNGQDDTVNAFSITGISNTGTNVTVNSPTIFPAVVPADGGGTVVDVDLECVPGARGNLSGTLTVANDADNPAGSEDYPFTCAGLSPNVQVPAGPVSLSGTLAGADPSDAITVTNPDDGFTSTANNLTAVAGAGDTQITVSGGPTNLAPDATFDFTVSCDSSVEGSFSRTIDFSWDDPAGPGTDSITVNCTVSDTAPVYNSDPVPGSTLTMSTPFGTESAPAGIDVSNGNDNPEADDLVINSATADDPVFSVTVINDTFPPNQGPDGNDDIEVTCTPPGVGTINGTLTVETNDPNEPADGFTYPLSCEGTGDEFSTSPDDGGTLNLGAVPPNTTTTERSIVFSNNRISGGGSVDVSCTVTDSADVFDFNPDPIEFTVAAGATESAGFQCTPSDVTTFSADVSCSFDGGDTGTANITVTCSGRPLVVPTMSNWGLVVMSLMLLLVGGFATRRMLA